MIVSLARFTPGARTNTLHVTDGIGLVVTRDGTVIRMRPGDTACTPPGKEHRHGATGSNFICHLAMLEGTGDGDGTTWLEPDTDDQYKTANEQQAPTNRQAAHIRMHRGARRFASPAEAGQHTREN
jgi:gentisate 1,2-dioxygenase